MIPMLATLVLLLCVGTPTAQEPPDLEQARRVAEILAQLREPGENTDVVKSLIPLGSAALPAAPMIIPQLKSRDAGHRLWVRTALASMGNGVIPILRRNLTADVSIRGEIYQTLSTFTTPSMELMEMFLDARDDNELQKEMAARAWIHNQNGPEHVLIWRRAVTHPRLRGPAIEVLGEVVLTEEWRTLLAALYLDISRTPGRAEIALLARLPEAGAGLLIGIASDRSSPLRTEALRTLSLLGDRAPGARALFLHVLADVHEYDPRDREAAVVAADAVSRLNTGRDEIVRRMLAVHRAVENLQIQAAILDSLPNLGDAAAPALPLVIAGLQSQNFESRQKAAVGALRIQEAHPTAVEALQVMLRDEDPALRLSTVSLLARAGDRGTPLLPVVRELLEDEDPLVRSRAQRTLQAIERRRQDPMP